MTGWGSNNQKISKNRLSFRQFIPGKAQVPGLFLFFGSASILFLKNISTGLLYFLILYKRFARRQQPVEAVGLERGPEAGAQPRRLVCLRRNE
jgi:hypothetical protein